MGKRTPHKSKKKTSSKVSKSPESPNIVVRNLRSSGRAEIPLPLPSTMKKKRAIKKQKSRVKKLDSLKNDKENVEEIEKEDYNEIHNNSSTSQTSVQPDITSDPSYSIISNYDIILSSSKFSLYSLVKLFKKNNEEEYYLYLYNSNEHKPSLHRFIKLEESIEEFTKIVQLKLMDGFSITNKEDIPELRGDNQICNTEEINPIIQYITNIQIMKKQIAFRNYNIEKVPLGSITKDAIVEGYNILKKIYYSLYKQDNNEELYNLSMIFYSIIPHYIHFKGSFQLITINDLDTLIQKINLLYSLEIINSIVYYVDNSLLNLNQLSQQLTPCQPNIYFIQVLSSFLSKNGLKLIEIYNICQEIDSDKTNLILEDIPDEPGEDNKNKTKALLWKGCYIEEAWKILLENTLQRKLNSESKWIDRIPPFGNNIVLYDNPRNAIMNNCYPLYQNEALLFLCETDITDIKYRHFYDDPSTNKIYKEETDEIIKLEGVNTYEIPQSAVYDNVILYTEECKNKNEVRNINIINYRVYSNIISISYMRVQEQNQAM